MKGRQDGMFRWIKRRLQRWLGIDSALVAALAAQERVSALMSLVHGGIDLHHKNRMKNWGVFVIRGKKRDAVKVVDLSKWSDDDLNAMITHLEKVAEVRVDAPWGCPEALRARHQFRI